MGGLLEQDPQSAELEDVPVDVTAENNVAPRMLVTKTTTHSLSMLGTALGSVSATVPGVTVFSVNSYALPRMTMRKPRGKTR